MRDEKRTGRAERRGREKVNFASLSLCLCLQNSFLSLSPINVTKEENDHGSSSSSSSDADEGKEGKLSSLEFDWKLRRARRLTKEKGRRRIDRVNDFFRSMDVINRKAERERERELHEEEHIGWKTNSSNICLIW